MRSLILCALAASVAGRMEVKENGQKVFYAEADNNCVVVTDEGTIDISTLPTTSLDMGQENYGQLGIYTWVISWCRQEQLLPSGGSSGSAPCDKQPSYAAKYAPTYCDYSNTGWETDLYATKVNGVWQVGYTVTQPAEGWVQRLDSNIVIECGAPNAGEAVSCIKGAGDSVCMVQQESTEFTTYFLKYRTNLVCLGGGGGSDSECKAACAFLIIFFLGGFLYLACGMAYNYKMKELRGIEMIPQLEFWKSVPGLIKDGGVFAFEKTKELINRARGN